MAGVILGDSEIVQDIVEYYYLDVSFSAQDLSLLTGLSVDNRIPPEHGLPIDVSLSVEQAEIAFDDSSMTVISSLDVTDRFLDVLLEWQNPEVLPDYEGDYTVVPLKREQVFDTKDHKMTDDMTVLAINYSEVLNAGGGLTVNIGYE